MLVAIPVRRKCRRHCQGGDPAGVFVLADVTGHETDHFLIHNSFQMDDSR